MLLDKNIIGFSKTGGICIIATKLYRQISTTALHFFATINKSGSSNHTPLHTKTALNIDRKCKILKL